MYCRSIWLQTMNSHEHYTWYYIGSRRTILSTLILKCRPINLVTPHEFMKIWVEDFELATPHYSDCITGRGVLILDKWGGVIYYTVYREPIWPQKAFTSMHLSSLARQAKAGNMKTDTGKRWFHLFGSHNTLDRKWCRFSSLPPAILAPHLFSTKNTIGH